MLKDGRVLFNTMLRLLCTTGHVPQVKIRPLCTQFVAYMGAATLGYFPCQVIMGHQSQYARWNE
jgi:hypothetical protein